MSEKIHMHREGELNKEEQAAKVFWEYLRVEDPLTPSDVIFAMGSADSAVPEKAAELYAKKIAPKIAFISVGGTFGGEKIWGMSESKKYREILEQHGVPAEAIIAGELSSNTLEEVQKAVPFFEQHGIKPKQVTLVATPAHQRRAWATFKKQFPEIQYSNAPANGECDLSDEATRKRLVDEAERLLDYAAKGDIEKQTIPVSILRAAVTLRIYLKQSGIYSGRKRSNKKTRLET